MKSAILSLVAAAALTVSTSTAEAAPIHRGGGYRAHFPAARMNYGGRGIYNYNRGYRGLNYGRSYYGGYGLGNYGYGLGGYGGYYGSGYGYGGSLLGSLFGLGNGYGYGGYGGYGGYSPYGYRW